MKKVLIIFVVAVLFLGFSFSNSFGLQQIAGKLEATLSPGGTTTIEWGLISDNPSEIITVELRAEGPGSEFLSFPAKVSLAPKKVEFIPITVTVPDDYTSNVTLNPSIFAVEKGEPGSAGVGHCERRSLRPGR